MKNKNLFRKTSMILGCTVLVAGLMIIMGFVGFHKNPKDEEKGSDDEFTIAILPDTQYYTSEKIKGKKEMFFAQTDWIVNNAAKEHIAYVIQLGDVSDDGEKNPTEWEYAADAMYRLEKPQAGYPEGIPYGLAVGNHDQTKSQYPISGKTTYFNRYFGVSHFEGKPWYGGHYREDNDSHYDLFTAAGIPLIVIYLEYDSFDEDIEPMNEWAESLLKRYKDRKAILVSHSLIGFNRKAGTNEKGFPKFSKQGQRIFDHLKRFPNVFLALCGHVGDNGEGYRQDGYAGHMLKTFLSDYQSRSEGGHGLMRLMTFSKKDDLIRVRTFSPYTGEKEMDADSHFSLPWWHHTTVARQMDFNNDSKTDIVCFDQGKWSINGKQTLELGSPGDIPVPADYNGDGKTEAAVFSPSKGVFIMEDGRVIKYGMKGDIPVPGDYDGDGFADIAVYRPSTMTWYILDVDTIKFGNKNGIPVPADYDGDGKIDVGFFRTTNSMWQTALGNIPLDTLHVAGDIPVPGDYDGDGRAEMAVFRPSEGKWIIDRQKEPIIFGKVGDLPIPGNYGQDGKLIPAVLRDGKILIYGSNQSLPYTNLKAESLVNISQAVRLATKKNNL